MDSAADTRAKSPGGLPHSETLGSKPARGSPRLFAACRVLPRLLAPRHPPGALLFPRHPPAASARARAKKARARAPAEEGAHTHAVQAGRHACLPRRRGGPRARGRKDPKTKGHGDRPASPLARARLARALARSSSPPTTARCPKSAPAAAPPPPPPSRRPGAGAAGGGGGRAGLVGLGRLERPTSRLSGVRSDRLSYRPETPPASLGVRGSSGGTRGGRRRGRRRRRWAGAARARAFLRSLARSRSRGKP